jgi:hypothetical protein
LTIYRNNRREASARALDESAVGTATLALVRGLRCWSGTAVELHGALSRIVGKEFVASSRWPRTTSTLSKELRRISSWLSTHGVSVLFEQQGDAGTITLTTEEKPERTTPGNPPPAPLRSVVNHDGETRRRPEVRFR